MLGRMARSVVPSMSRMGPSMVPSMSQMVPSMVPSMSQMVPSMVPSMSQMVPSMVPSMSQMVPSMSQMVPSMSHQVSPSMSPPNMGLVTNYNGQDIRAQLERQQKQIDELTKKFKEIKVEEPKNNQGKTFSDYVKDSWDSTFSKEGIKKTAAYNIVFIPILIILYFVCKANNEESECDKNIIKYIIRQLNFFAPTITNSVTNEQNLIDYFIKQSKNMSATEEGNRTKISFTYNGSISEAYVSNEDLQKITKILEQN